MRFYLAVLKYNFLTELTYPVEILGSIARKIIGLGFLILFWSVISKTNNSVFDFHKIVSYFLISQAVADLTFSSGSWFGRSIQKSIKEGVLSNHLLKPVDILRYLFVSYIGSKPTSFYYSIITLTLGLIIYPPAAFINYILFAITLVFTTITSAGINVLIGVAGFYSPEAGHIKNIYEHISRVFSGALVPLDYFPLVLKQIASLSPFPILAYYPTIILQQGGMNNDTYLKLFLCMFWAFTLLIVSNLVWKKALKNYDGVGI